MLAYSLPGTAFVLLGLGVIFSGEEVYGAMITIGGALLLVGAAAAWSPFQLLQKLVVAASVPLSLVAFLYAFAPISHMFDPGYLRLAFGMAAVAFAASALMLLRHIRGANGEIGMGRLKARHE
jgi:hypothetical protein